MEKIEKFQESVREKEIFTEVINNLKIFLQKRRNIIFEEKLGENLSKISLNESPFQVVSKTPLSKLHFLFSMLSPKVAYVTEHGILVGVLTKDFLIKYLG